MKKFDFLPKYQQARNETDNHYTATPCRICECRRHYLISESEPKDY